MFSNRRYKYRGGCSRISESTTSSQRTDVSVGRTSSKDVTVHTVSSATSVGSVLGHQSDKENDQPAAKLQKLQPSLLGEDEEMFVIPASQITTQSRYISQRSMLHRTQTSQQSSNRIARNYFELALQKCAVNFDAPECFVLSMDHISFVSKMRQQLMVQSEGADRKVDFIAGLEETLGETAGLLKIMSGCKVVYRNSDTAKLTQESLMQDFIMIDCIQEELLRILLDLLNNYAVQNDGNSISIVQLILSHVQLIDQQRHGQVIFDRIFEILKIACTSAKRSIIGSLEYLIDLTMHDQVLDRVFELFPNNEELLTEETVATFGNMSINAKTRQKLRLRIVEYMGAGASDSLFPSFVHFLLQLNNDEMDAVPKLLCDLRKTLRWNQPDSNRSQSDLTQRAVFDRIYSALIQSKKLFDIWLKTIQNSSTLEREPSFDMLVLLVMQQLNDEKRNFIENVVRKQIKLSLFTVANLKELAENYPIVLREYSKVLLEMLNNFFKDKDPLLAAFARSSYSLIYGIEHWDRKLILSKLVGFVCQVDRDGDHKSEEITTSALSVLTTINKTSPDAMQIYGNQLMRILDHTEYMNLGQVRLFMDLLCSVAFPIKVTGPECELQEHLDMLIRKQVSSSFIKIKLQGIIGITRVIDHIVWHEEAIEEDSNVTYEFIDDLPDAVARKAAKYFELIKSVTRNCPISLTLCYDELSSIVSRRNERHKTLELNSCFAAWLCDLVTDEFQLYFVAEGLPTRADCAGVELQYDYCLNTVEESSNVNSEVESIAVNIGGCVLKKSSRASSSIGVLTSLFNLMRVLHFHRNKGNLESINAVLGCAIFVPKDLALCEDVFGDYDDEQAPKIMDILFYTVNWIRVCISAFVTQEDPMIRRKVLLRMSKLVELQTMIRHQLKNAPKSYSPPMCQLSANEPLADFKKPYEKTQRIAKKTTSPSGVGAKDLENMTILTALSNPMAATKAEGKWSPTMYGPKEIYRVLDPDVMLLLRESLDLEQPLSPEKIGLVLGISDFEFLIDDLVSRMESICGIRKSQTVLQNSNIIVPADFVSDLSQFIQDIFKHFNQLLVKLKEIIDSAADQVSHKYTDEANHVKNCVRLLVRLMAGYFDWTGFNEDQNHEILSTSLVSITNGDKNADISALAKDAIDVFLAHEPIMIDLTTAGHLFQLIEALSKFLTTANSHQYSVQICKQLLSRRWFGFDASAERGAKCNATLDELLRGMFVRIKISTMHQMLTQTMDDISVLHRKDRVLALFPCINKTNFPLLFRKLCVGLISAVHRRMEKNGPNIAHLKLWEESSDLLNNLLTVIESINIPRNFVLFSKFAHNYVKLFLQNGLPMLEKCFRQYADRVREILRSLQKTTRFLHRLCCHSKTIKNSTIVAQIPLLRESIELLLVRVKALLVANKCCTTDIWEIGNLKNKDIHGHIVDEVNDDDVSDIPEDDDPVDDENLDETVHEHQADHVSVLSKSSSRSRVF